MIRIIDFENKKRIATVRSYIEAQEYAERNRIPPGRYYLLPVGIKSVAGIRVLEVVYVEVDGIREPTAEILNY